MATDASLKDYLANRSDVKNAKKTLSSAKAPLADLQRALDSAPAASKADIQKRIAAAKKDADKAQADFNSVVAAAKDYYKNNIDTINADTKIAQKNTDIKSLADAKAMRDRLIQANQDTSTIDKTIAELTGKANAKPQVTPPPGNTETIDGTKPVVRDYAKEITGAAQLIYSMTDHERSVLSSQLKDAGFKVPVSGKYNDALTAAYQTAVSNNQLRNTQIPNLNQSLAEFLVTKAKEPGAGGTKGGPTTDATIFSPTNAALYINSEFQQFLKRDATSTEISTLTKQLTDAQRKNPDKLSTDANGNTVRVQGLNAQGFLDGLIKKLPEFTKKLEGKTATTLEGVLNTARDNSIIPTQSQIDSWTNRLKTGEDAATIQHEIRNLAAIGRPDAIAKQLLAGNDLGTILSPYKQYMQSTLEIPAEQIALTDPSLQMAIAGDKPMSLYDYQNALRKDNRWQYTQNAKTDVSNSIQQVLKDFGFMG
jgi:hypothetical protein